MNFAEERSVLQLVDRTRLTLIYSFSLGVCSRAGRRVHTHKYTHKLSVCVFIIIWKSSNNQIPIPGRSERFLVKTFLAQKCRVDRRIQS